mgnify:FL=1
MSHYRHLSIEERESLLLRIGEGKTLREITKILRRSPSTLSRELKRNCEKKRDYSPEKATKNYHKRRKKCCRQRILKNPAAKALVQHLFLEQQWSPEQIANRLKLEHNEIQVSYATIYLGDLETERLSHGQRGVARKLRHRGKTRRRKGTEERRGKIAISHPIEERPEEAQRRTELGHWEADTVAGKTGSSCMVTLVDRKSRFLLGRRVSRKAATEVEEGMIALLISLPPELRRSVTPDRGKEFVTHPRISTALNDLPFYFPRPHAPWERGTNENTNGLIREYCPKSVDMNSFDASYFDDFIAKLNLRPRKCLGWKSPAEVFYGTLLHLT